VLTAFDTVRCGLTFLAIQAPNISKFCGICGKQYLGNGFILDQESEQNRTEHQGDVSGTAQGRCMPILYSAIVPSCSSIGAPLLTLVVCTDGATLPPKDKSASERLEVLEDIDMVDAPVSNEVNGREIRQPTSLARMLSAACDVCVYCGGKFVG